MKSEIEAEMVVRAAKEAGFCATLSRRQFLFLCAGAVTSLAALNTWRVWGADAPIVITDNAKGLLLADPSRCVGCLRCELACTEFNDGRAQPSLARIKVGRNMNFGPEGPLGGARMQGAWGNGLFIQDTCRQCPHPVPCATACPENAIQAAPETGARIVDTSACVGCRLCQRACPWNMIGFDEQSQKATKCFLCQGVPKCVEACPSGALRYVAWRDLTREAAPRAALLVVPPEKAKGCLDCHKP
ncbi:MAG TPA: 4Fe-4S dicluster domain-containing protein [Syntrophobacteria bacterium]|nr:4Fe-4S dicluster domain-containing protein [Syntrophobacteria bacterium]